MFGKWVRTLARTDFHETADRAAALVADATMTLRELMIGSLPAPHTRLVSSAIRNLEDAQRDIFLALNDPYGRGSRAVARARPIQMELL